MFLTSLSQIKNVNGKRSVWLQDFFPGGESFKYHKYIFSTKRNNWYFNYSIRNFVFVISHLTIMILLLLLSLIFNSVKSYLKETWFDINIFLEKIVFEDGYRTGAPGSCSQFFYGVRVAHVLVSLCACFKVLNVLCCVTIFFCLTVTHESPCIMFFFITSPWFPFKRLSM